VRYTGIYRARVIDNSDVGEKHEYYGAIKVIVPEIHGEEIPHADLPWAYPCLPIGNGKDIDSYDYCSLYVPPIETWVWVMFEHGDVNRPVYVGGWIGGEESELPEIFKTDDRSSGGVGYPNIKGWTFGFDGGSFTLRIVGERRLEIYFDKDNIIEIDSVGDPPNEEKQIGVRSDWLIKLESNKKVELKAPEINIEAESKLTMKSGGTSDWESPTAVVKGGVVSSYSTVLGNFKHPVE